MIISLEELYCSQLMNVGDNIETVQLASEKKTNTNNFSVITNYDVYKYFLRITLPHIEIYDV